MERDMVRRGIEDGERRGCAETGQMGILIRGIYLSLGGAGRIRSFFGPRVPILAAKR